MCRTAGSGWNYEATFIYSIIALMPYLGISPLLKMDL